VGFGQVCCSTLWLCQVRKWLSLKWKEWFYKQWSTTQSCLVNEVILLLLKWKEWFYKGWRATQLHLVDEVNVSWFPNEVVIANLLNYSRSQLCWKVRQHYIGFGTMDKRFGRPKDMPPLKKCTIRLNKSPHVNETYKQHDKPIKCVSMF